MSHTFQRRNHPSHRPKFKRKGGIGTQMEPSRRELTAAADRAVDVMAAGIQDEIELEEIVAKSRPHLRDSVRERLIPHLSFKVAPRIHLT
jgi:hypothetical protein